MWDDGGKFPAAWSVGGDVETTTLESSNILSKYVRVRIRRAIYLQEFLTKNPWVNKGITREATQKTIVEPIAFA